MWSSTTMPRSTVEAGGFGEARAGADADGHDDEVGGDLAAVFQQDAGDVAFAQNRLGVGAGDDADAARLKLALEQEAGGFIKLALHDACPSGGSRSRSCR